MNPTLDFVMNFVRLAWGRARETVHDDRGSTTLENVGWYIAAGLGVVVVAGILWAAIKSKASEPLPSPSAP